MRQGPVYSMPAQFENEQLVVNIPLEIIEDFYIAKADRVIVTWRDEKPYQYTITVDLQT